MVKGYFMTLNFYPHTDDAQKGSLLDRIEVLADAAERYKAFVLDDAAKLGEASENLRKASVPRDQNAAYNWEEIAKVLREARELSEASKDDKLKKADVLTKLAEVYEVLRGAKMSKLEAVRLALVSEATQLRGSAS